MTERHIGYLIKQINEQIKQRADSDMECCGVTFAQGRIIGYIAHCGGEVPQKQIAQYLGVTHPTVTGTLSRMEQKGLLTFREDPGDRRGKLVSLTEKSAEAGAKLTGLIAAQERRIVSGLSPEQADTLQELLEAVLKNVSGQPEVLSQGDL